LKGHRNGTWTQSQPWVSQVIAAVGIRHDSKKQGQWSEDKQSLKPTQRLASKSTGDAEEQKHCDKNIKTKLDANVMVPLGYNAHGGEVPNSNINKYQTNHKTIADTIFQL
jgi:hypothetical protein